MRSAGAADENAPAGNGREGGAAPSRPALSALAAVEFDARRAALLGRLDAQDLLAPGEAGTYSLLIGVWLRDPDELEALRAQTVAPLAAYDARQGTALLATLCAFLAHDGSTTEAAGAMRLHRHTVGYRLNRIHEVCGLSPYESSGRERLGLGVKAQRIIESAAGMAQSQLTL